jgi:hypothetical protein
LIDRGGTDPIADHNFFMPAPLPYPTGVDNVNILGAREIQWANMDVSGAFFTGLSLLTTLTINWNIYIERFPSDLETDLVVLARPSPAYCPMAFELYKSIAMSLPVGVMQKENGLGDWFRDAVSSVAEFVTPVLSMIPHPVAQAGALIGKTVGNMARRTESATPYVAESAEKAFLRPQNQRQPIPRPKAREVVKEVKKEIKREVKPFLRKSKMSVIPVSTRARKK